MNPKRLKSVLYGRKSYCLQFTIPSPDFVPIKRYRIGK